MELIVSNFGTIKSNGNYLDDSAIEEMQLETFLSKLEKQLDNFYCSNEENEEGKYVNNKCGVLNSSESKDTYKIYLDGHKYELVNKKDNAYYPIIKEKLDLLVEKTKEIDYKEKVIRDFENGKFRRSEKDLKIYLEYLSHQKNDLSTSKAAQILIIIFAILGIPLSALLISVTSKLSLVTFILSLIVALPIGLISLGGLLGMGNIVSKLKGIIKDLSINKLKSEKLNKLLNDVEDINLKIDSGVKITQSLNINYKDNIIRYMNSIMQAASTMNAKDRKSTLLELRNILDEYTSKMTAVNTNNHKLTLEGDETRKIMIDTINKLSSLEIVIADIKKRDSENMEVTSESEILRGQINSFIASAEEENTSGAYMSLSMRK